eukprot:9394979-Alexandrium_andersonii.AAC.1
MAPSRTTSAAPWFCAASRCPAEGKAPSHAELPALRAMRLCHSSSRARCMAATSGHSPRKVLRTTPHESV